MVTHCHSLPLIATHCRSYHCRSLPLIAAQVHDLTGDDCLHPVNGRHGISYVTQMMTHWFDHAHELWLREVHNGRQSASQPLDAADESAHQRMNLRLQALNDARERALSWTEKEPLHPSANKRDQLPTRCLRFAPITPSDDKKFRRLEWCSPNEVHEDAPQANASCHPSSTVEERPSCPPEIQKSVSRQPAGRRLNPIQKASIDEVYRAFMASPPASWVWCPVSLSPKNRKPSEGVVALRPGAVLVTSFDAYLASVTSDQIRPATSVTAADVAADVTVLLEHLVSYQGMGRVLVECQAGCTCKPQVIDGHHVDPIRNTSVFVETSLAVCAVASQSCRLQITVLRDSSSGLHKFKLRSLRVKATAGNTGRPGGGVRGLRPKVGMCKDMSEHRGAGGLDPGGYGERAKR